MDVNFVSLLLTLKYLEVFSLSVTNTNKETFGANEQLNSNCSHAISFNMDICVFLHRKGFCSQQ